jgi:hypothetical protein
VNARREQMLIELLADRGVSMARARRLSKKDAASLEKHGCTYSELRELRALCRLMGEEGVTRERQPIGAFCRQRQSARQRGIGWELKLWDWWMIWSASGRWDQRGRGEGYVMSRYGDEGPYRKDNVYIGTARENNSKTKRKQSGLPMGVNKCGWREGYVATAQKWGKQRYLGVYDSPEVAELAYLIFIYGVAQNGTSDGA